MNHAILAVIQFGHDEDIDSLLERFVTAQLANGHKVKGALQSRGTANGECHCADMDLHLVGSDKVFRISQTLGNGSSGCRLHPGRLAQCAAELERQIESGCDILVLNRFGKGESEGRGFRDLISKAVACGIPVLTATRETYLEAWDAFSGDLGIKLPCDPSAVDGWFVSLARPQAA